MPPGVFQLSGPSTQPAHPFQRNAVSRNKLARTGPNSRPCVSAMPARASRSSASVPPPETQGNKSGLHSPSGDEWTGRASRQRQGRRQRQGPRPLLEAPQLFGLPIQNCNAQERERERERELLGAIHNGGSRAEPGAQPARCTPRAPHHHATVCPIHT